MWSDKSTQMLTNSPVSEPMQASLVNTAGGFASAFRTPSLQHTHTLHTPMDTTRARPDAPLNPTDALYKTFLTFEEHQTESDQGWQRGVPSTWFANKGSGFFNSPKKLPALVKSWEVKEPFVVDGKFLNLLQQNMVLIHKKLIEMRESYEAGQCKQAYQTLAGMKVYALKVSENWEVSVVDQNGNAVSLSGFDIGQFFTNRPYLLRSKDLYECQQMPWWGRCRDPWNARFTDQCDDEVHYIRDCVIPNPYPPFKAAFDCMRFGGRRTELKKPSEWNYPKDLKTSLWYQEAGPLYHIGSGFKIEKTPEYIPELRGRSEELEALGERWIELKESEWQLIPRPVLVEAPVDHRTFDIDPVELYLLGYEMKKVEMRALCACISGTGPAIFTTAWARGEHHRFALGYEAVAIGNAGDVCIEAARRQMTLRVPEGGGKPFWMKHGKALPDLRPGFHDTALLLSKRRWLFWLPDMTLRLQRQDLATPRGDKDSVFRWT